LAVPSWEHAYGPGVACVKFTDSVRAFFPICSVVLAKNVELITDMGTFEIVLARFGSVQVQGLSP
jgi:hypothetical protein